MVTKRLLALLLAGLLASTPAWARIDQPVAGVTKGQGGTGATTGSGAATNLSMSYVVCQSAATGMSIATGTSEVALANCQIPAGLLGLNGSLSIKTDWTVTASTNNKTLKVKLHTATGTGGTAYMSFNVNGGTLVSAGCATDIFNRASASVQSGSGAWCVNSQGTAGATVTTSIDTAVATWINITGQPASNGETITLNSYRVVFMPGGGN